MFTSNESQSKKNRIWPRNATCKQQAPPDPREELRLVTQFCLENDFQCQLGVERLSGSQSGSAVEVANGIGHLPEAFGGRTYSRGWISTTACANGSNAGSKVLVVKQIEHLHAELRSHSLPDCRTLPDSTTVRR